MIGDIIKKGKNGYTLIEVLVALLILSIAIVPATKIFSSVIKDTITGEKTLKANQLASMFMESLKSKDVDYFATLFGDGTTVNTNVVSFPAGTDGTASKLPSVPDEFEVEVKLNNGIYRNLIGISNEVKDFDMYVEIGTGKSDTPIIYDKNMAKKDNFINSSNNERVIEIEANEVANELSIAFKDGSGASLGSYSCPITHKAIVFDLANKSSNKNIETTIKIDSDISDKLKVFMYEDLTAEESAKYEVELQDTSAVELVRNLKKPNVLDSNFILCKVRVLDDDTKETIFEVEGSVINE